MAQQSVTLKFVGATNEMAARNTIWGHVDFQFPPDFPGLAQGTFRYDDEVTNLQDYLAGWAVLGWIPV